jgi:hypothetical protein
LFYGGVFVTCASVMMLQVIETRLLSVMSHYYLEVYAADLIGASLGCLGALGLLEVFDGPSALLVIACTAAIAASLFARSAGVPIPPAGDIAARFTSRSITLALVLSGLAILNASHRGPENYAARP